MIDLFNMTHSNCVRRELYEMADSQAHSFLSLLGFHSVSDYPRSLQEPSR